MKWTSHWLASNDVVSMRDDQTLRELFAVFGGRWKHYRSLASIAQYRNLWRLFRQYVPLGAEVLDWGAGTGHFSYFLCRFGYRVTGYSLDDCLFQDLVAEFPYQFVRGRDPVVLPFPDSCFDAVASVGVLEHVRETGGSELASLHEIMRVLRSSGFLICYHLPNRYSWIDYLARRFPGKHKHNCRYTLSDIEKLTSAVNFELLYCRRYGFLPRNSLATLPAMFRRSMLFAVVWDKLDTVFGLVFSLLCQNYMFVGRKK
jgi:SAM-dependent methyltransferase